MTVSARYKRLRETKNYYVFEPAKTGSPLLGNLYVDKDQIGPAQKIKVSVEVSK